MIAMMASIGNPEKIDFFFFSFLQVLFIGLNLAVSNNALRDVAVLFVTHFLKAYSMWTQN